MSSEDGTPKKRFEWLMNELDLRFPDPHPYLSSRTTEQHYLAEIDKTRTEVAELRWRVRDLERLYAVITGPDGDGGKFNYLMQELQKRFGAGENKRTREEIDYMMNRVDTLLQGEEHY